jgi:hypothetical protein
VNTPYPFFGSKKAMAVGLSLADQGLLVEDVECDAVVDVEWGTAEGDDVQPDSTMAAAATPTSKTPRGR